MKNHILGSALALVTLASVAPFAKADPGPTTTATSTITVTVPSTITFTVNNVPFGTLTSPTADATGKSIAANLTTNYNAVSLQVRANAPGARTRGGGTGTGTLLAGDIEITNGTTTQALAITDAPLGTLTGFVPNVIKPYSFPVAIRHINNYEQGAYSGTVIFTATGS